MTVANEVTAQRMGRSFAESASREPAAKRLWVAPREGYVELWLLTEPTDADTERRLYGASMELYDRFPDAHFRIGVLNPSLSEGWDPMSEIPPDAEEIPLRPA